MEPDILSVTTGQRDRVTLRAGPSPTLDLIYACHYLRRLRRRPDEAPRWAAELIERDADLVERVAALAGDAETSHLLLLTFALALDRGYVWDATPDRFIDDLPRLAHDVRAAAQAGDLPQLPDDLRTLVCEIDPERWPHDVTSVLAPLWDALASYWQTQGRALVEAAAAEVEERFREHGDVVHALPPHHFAQFEALASELRRESERGALFVVPLALASGGGFHLSSSDVAALGFGLASEDVHARTEAQVATVARRAKALSDPTRLMLLSLLARYADARMTVGDLARELGVSQPTVSGHLKVLKQAGLIAVEREGNRSLPRLASDAVRDLLGDLDDVLHRPDLS